MNELPVNLYRAAQVRALDRIAIAEFKLPGATLMERAGAACFAQLTARWPAARSVGVLCGAGNNGGDGFVIARLAYAAGVRVSVLQVGERDKIHGDALTALQRLEAAGVPVIAWDANALPACDVWVDALLGTGLRGTVTGAWRAAIAALNASGLPVLAVDVPSGLDADTGHVWGDAVRASATVTFIGLKQGLFTGAGPGHVGVLSFDNLQIPAAVFARELPSATRIADAWTQIRLPARQRSAHKGHFGHVAILGGDHGMSGAARLAGEAAVRAGAGLVSVATRPEHAALLSMARPELMCHGVTTAAEVRRVLERATVAALGPGLGQSAWARELFGQILDSDLPCVIDADALNLLAAEPLRRDHWVLTPHPGEAARLLNNTVAQVQRDRFAAAYALQAKYGGVVVLKGAGTLVATPDSSVYLCDAGNPGMASGGMGDVLTGVIASLLAQGLSLTDAACVGVWVHATAADRAAQDGERGLLASDVLAHLRRHVNL
ncbi:MAG: NAD(P)H-hydrate dehydratase [Gammaproteobacteria bacterium]|nr:NAD(P)H-hydrate dehydratase [Gammaproteobacteria bacterium]